MEGGLSVSETYDVVAATRLLCPAPATTTSYVSLTDNPPSITRANFAYRLDPAGARRSRRGFSLPPAPAVSEPARHRPDGPRPCRRDSRNRAGRGRPQHTRSAHAAVPR